MNNKEKMKMFYETIASTGVVEGLSEYVSESCVLRVGETILPLGIDGMKRHLLDVRTTYPDLQMTIIRQHADGDYIISEFIATGTHLGEWLGMKPTGKKLQFIGVDIDKVVDGKLVEHGGAMDSFSPLFDAGIIKPAE